MGLEKAIDEIRSEIARKEQDLARTRELLGMLEKFVKNQPPSARPAPPPASRLKRIAPGSVGARILESLEQAKGPLRKRQLFAECKAPMYAFERELTALRGAGKVKTTGARSSLRYFHPKFATASESGK